MRLIFSIWLGKIIFSLTRFLGRGGGSAAPGYYALKICPDLVTQLAQQISQSVVVTGTNGKTTTAKLLAHFAHQKYPGILRNDTGSNLERGVASALIQKANILGQISGANLAIWEVDEAAFVSLLPKLKPNKAIILNAFRDQLDRYGEVDTVVKNWHQSLAKVDWPLEVVINGSDPNLSSLAEVKGVKFRVFRVEGHDISWESLVKVKSAFTKADVVAKVIRSLGLEGVEFEIKVDGQSRNVRLKFPGIYHVYDVTAAVTMGRLLDFEVDEMLSSLDNFEGAFGRVEQIQVGDKSATIFLIKNPVGASLVFETLDGQLTPGDVMLLALNDNFADGTDVSWIWDAEFELLAGEHCRFICSGTRAADLAVRLKYAGVEPKAIVLENDLSRALKQAQKESQGRIFILPTYTSLLQLQALFTQLHYKKSYWRNK